MGDDIFADAPRSLLAEQMVLGSIIVEGLGGKMDGYWQVAQILQERDFYAAQHRLLFRAVAKLAKEGIAPGTFVLAEALSKRGQIDDAGGDAYLVELGRQGGAGRGLLAYAGAVRERSLLRQLAAAAADVADIARAEGEASAEQRVGESLDRLFAVAQASQHGGSGEDLDMDAMLGMVVEHLADMQRLRERGGIIGVTTGIQALDDATGGMVQGDLIVMGGRPGMGKTAAALSIAYHAGLAGARVGFVSTEMSGKQVGLRLAALDARVPAVRMRDGSLSEPEYVRLSAAFEKLRKMPMRTLDKASCTLADIHVQARMWKARHGLDVVLVDYLQRLHSTEKAERRDLEVTAFAAALKTLARDLDIPVVALSQLRREVANRADKRPTMADLRESGGIEQEADSVWLLHRPSFYDENADASDGEIIIDKNRHGPCEIIRARWEPEVMHWTGRAEYQPSEEVGE